MASMLFVIGAGFFIGSTVMFVRFLFFKLEIFDLGSNLELMSIGVAGCFGWLFGVIAILIGLLIRNWRG